MLHLTDAYPSYAQALHHSAISTITGEPLGVETGLAQVLDVLLAVYSVVVVAALAGSIGAYFLHERQSANGRHPDQDQ